MKSVTLVVIFAGLVSYSSVTTPTPTPSTVAEPSYASFIYEPPPASFDPDDHEDEERVHPKHKSNRSNKK